MREVSSAMDGCDAWGQVKRKEKKKIMRSKYY